MVKGEAADVALQFFIIGRGVRSTLNLSPKNLQISKWSKSGEFSSKRPKLSISMADNVISYKKNHKKRSKHQNR